MNKKELKKMNKDVLINLLLKQQKQINRLSNELLDEMAEHWGYERQMSKIVSDIIKMM